MPLNRISFHGNWNDKIAYLQNNQNELAEQVLTMQDFEQALKNVRPSVPTSALQKYHDWMAEQGSG